MTLRLERCSADAAKTVKRPGCVGMRAANIARGDAWDATALYFSPHASSDDHAAPFEQWLVVTRGSGWVSVGDDSAPVRAGDALALPRDLFHRFWTETDEMDALALTFESVRGAELVRVPDRAALAHNAAQRFVTHAQDAISARGRFAVALSGGSTPRDLYALLATPEFAGQADWAHVHVFWADERAVPPDHPESNYRMAYETLIARVPVPAQNVHRILAEQDPDNAARAYEQTLREFFPSSALSKTGEGLGVNPPRFDLILLGLGTNGHTASLFPHTRVLHETARWVAAEYMDEVKLHRITLTAPVINAAANILFLVTGADKASTVRDVLRGNYRPDDLPAQLIQPTQGSVVWLFDREAAGVLVEQVKA